MTEIKDIQVYDLFESWIASSFPMRIDYSENFYDRVNNLKHWASINNFLSNFVDYIDNQSDKDIQFNIYKDNTCDIVLSNGKIINVNCESLPNIFINIKSINFTNFDVNPENINHNTIKIGLWDAIQDYKRAIKLHNASANSEVKCHDNWLVGVRVSFTMKYPQYLSPELQRYHWIDIVSSSSKMHKLASMKLSNGCNKYVDPKLIKIAQKYIDQYNENPTYENRMLMISNCPLGLELFMRISTDYKQLQNIYFQRKNHRLKEDWGAICDMIRSLPFSKQLITGDDKK